MEEGNYEDYQDEYDYENDEIEDEYEDLPPDAKEYYEYKNQIDILKKQKKLLESSLKEAKQTYRENKSLKKSKQKSPFKKNVYNDYKDYEKQILSNMIDDQLFDGIGTSKDILGKFVDRVLDRSLYVYRNRNCHTCSKLLSKGMSTQRCPKCHHLLRDLQKLRQKKTINK